MEDCGDKELKTIWTTRLMVLFKFIKLIMDLWFLFFKFVKLFYGY